MSLSRMVTTEHVHHAIQLFKLSTLEAAKGGLNREYMTEAERDRVKSAEAIILQKLPIGGKASKSSILRDLKLRGYDTFHIGKTLSLLIQKGILEERGDATVKRIAIGQRTV
jgi:DNA replication licensing factor MCM5